MKKNLKKLWTYHSLTDPKNVTAQTSCPWIILRFLVHRRILMENTSHAQHQLVLLTSPLKYVARNVIQMMMMIINTASFFTKLPKDGLFVRLSLIPSYFTMWHGIHSRTNRLSLDGSILEILKFYFIEQRGQWIVQIWCNWKVQEWGQWKCKDSCARVNNI